MAIHVAVYNFVRMQGSLKMTPAMAAGVIDKHWKMEDLYDAVMEQADKNKNTHFDFNTYDTYQWYLDLGPLSNINDKYLHGATTTN